jgi:hypothetical protein
MNDPATGGNQRKFLTVSVLALAAVAISLFVLWNGGGRGYEINRKLSFDGSSDELRHTTVVATYPAGCLEPFQPEFPRPHPRNGSRHQALTTQAQEQHQYA